MTERPIAIGIARTTAVKPGALAVFEVNGTPIAVANVGGSFYAFDDTCTHERCSLADGVLEGTTVACPCHGAEFDVRTGAVLAPPAVEPVKTYPVHVREGHLVVEV